MRRFISTIPFVFILLLALPLLFAAVTAQEDDPTEEGEMTEEEMLLARGEYLANITGCIGCHTPYKEEYADFSALTIEQIQTVALFAEDTQDLENKLLAGGRPFDLGPAGVLFSANLTPHETGIGDWTDEEIEVALRIGVNPSGRRLHPLMPYRNFYNMADSDVRAIITFLRSLEPVEHEVSRDGPSGEGIAPELVPNEEVPEMPPDGSDPVELGAYLVDTVMSCADCHTPLDPLTGAPEFDRWLAGGQAYEGPWGIVYGGNITPHDETGIGEWEGEDIGRVLQEGVRIDGRRLVLMPWQDYRIVTDDDVEAIVAYLRSIEPIDNEVPAPSINEAFLQYVEEE